MTQTAEKIDKVLLKDTFGVVLLDRSGSMSEIKEQTVTGLNKFFKDQRKDPTGLRMSLIFFDSQSIDTIYESLPMENVPNMSHALFQPRDSTPLFDSIAYAIDYADKNKKENEQVMIIIMTDGLENASKEHTRESLRALIVDREQIQGWKFVFLGANQDAWEEASKMGIVGASITYDSGTAGLAMAASSSHMTSYRSGEEYSTAPINLAEDDEPDTDEDSEN